VVLGCQVTDLQATVTVVQLPAASQRMGCIVTGCQLSSTSMSFTYCIFYNVWSAAVILEYSTRPTRLSTRSSTPVANYSIVASLISCWRGSDVNSFI